MPMRTSIAWLKTFCDPGFEPAELAECLTLHGLEAAPVVPVPAPSERIVAARLRAVVPLPRTNYKRIDADAGGAGVFQVISAAPNAREGMVGVVALPGAYLPDGRLIETRRYAGQPSEAMLCSAVEVGVGEVSDRLLELPSDTAPGTLLAAVYGLPDVCLEVEPTPNRGDCLSLLGIAREVRAATGAPLAAPVVEPIAASGEVRRGVRLEAADACPRYLGRTIEGLDAAATTPIWLAERLRRSGLRVTHPVVDVLNYVMIELGQPMHAFAADSLRDAVRVRRARAGETLTLLHGESVELSPDFLVIADDSGPIALAGIMGGAATAVGAGTRKVFLESAFFAPAAVRGRARRLGLATEAAHRFERGVDPELPRTALERATALILEIAGGTPGPVVVAESAGNLPTPPAIRLQSDALERLTGMILDHREIAGILGRLGFSLEAADDGSLVARPPSWRFDIEGEADLVEEIARIAGFDRIPAAAPYRTVAVHRDRDSVRMAGRMAGILTARGYDEALTMSFTDPGRDADFGADGAEALAIANPLSEYESVLRRSLWPGLAAALAYNVARQAERVRLFEIGPAFGPAGGESRQLAGVACGGAMPEQWAVAPRDMDFYDVKSDVEALLAAAGVTDAVYKPSSRAALVPGRRACVEYDGQRIAEFGVVAPEIAARWGLPAATALFEIRLDALPERPAAQAGPVPRFPVVRRDLALVVPATVSAAALVEAVGRFGGPRLAAVRIFDTYTGVGIPSGARSIAMGLIFRDLSRTLTDGEVDQAVSAIMTGLAEEMGAHVRN